jgi:class 3 adenylate cyclase/tetratricopeptide (TPR) repeat protein
MPVCSNCGKENPDEARFCLACGTPIAEATPAEPAAPAEERKLITVVFTDLVGSTARSEGLDPEDVKAMVAPYHARVRAELERHGGTFEKFSGDAVMALFGAPVAHEDDCERAVRAALAIRDAVAGLNEGDEWLDLHIRVGVNTGEALVTLDARPSEGEWMAAGDVMNTAARMQSAAPVDGIFVGQETYWQTRHVVEYRDADAIEAKGKSERVPVWEAVALRDRADGRPTAEARLVGREAEREALMDWWRATVESRRPRLATVLGSPGIGKSRLLAELATRTGSEAHVHWGRCLSYGEGITYWPVTEIIKDAAGIHHDDGAAATSGKLGALLESLECDDLDQLRTIAAAVSNIVGVATTPAGTYSAAEIGQAELHWGLRRLLELLAQKRPLVLVFEDLHWGEPTLLDLIQFVLESESEAPILLVGSARPEAKDARPVLYTPAEQRLVLELEALGESESAELLEELAAAQGLSGSALETVLRNAGGNPLFLEETVRMLAESGALAAADGEALPVPSSLQALIASRLDQLPADEKRLAQHASVVGTVFWPGALASLNGVGDVDANLAALERRDIVRPRTGSAVTGEREYAFKHILIRDVAYNQLPKRRRAVLHRRFADWTEALPGEDEFVEIVAYHLEQACLIAREIARSPEPPPIREAAQALKRAGEKAESREGFREADRFYVRALELVGDEYRDLAAELHLRRGRMMAAQGELAAAAEGLVEVVEETATLDLQDLRCAALIALANAEWKQGHAVDSRAHLGEADEVAGRLGDRRLEVRVAFEFAHLRWWIDGEHEAAIADLRRGLRIAEELEDRALRIEGHMRLGFLLFNLGDLGESETELLRCSALAGELGSHRDEARVTFQLALVKYYRGELDEAERLGAQAFDWFARTSDGYFQLQNRRALAIYALARSDLGAAEEFLRDALPAALDAGGFMVVEIYRYLIDVLTRQGRFDDASELLVFASRNVPEEDVYARAALLLAEATLATAGGEGNAATASFAEALRLLEDLQLVIDLAEARLAFGRALRSFGEETGARTELERARAMFARMDARFVLDEIDRELAELSPVA